MKNIRIVHGTLMYPLEVGSRALIFEEGRYFHTSTAISTEEVEKCMRWSFVPQAGITSGYAARSVKRKLRLSACVKVSRI